MFTRKSKASIQDSAGVLPDKIKDLETEINEVFNKAKTLPNGIELLATVKSIREKTSDKELNELNNALEKKYNELWYQCAALIPLLEKGFDNLRQLAELKLQLTEDARLRQAKIHTGNVKADIDRKVPDEKLSELADKLQQAYHKFNATFIFILTHIYSTTLMFQESKENFSFQKDLRELEKKQIDFKSAWLKKLLNNLVEARKETTTLCKGLPEFMEQKGLKLKTEQKPDESDQKKFTP